MNTITHVINATLQTFRLDIMTQRPGAMQCPGEEEPCIHIPLHDVGVVSCGDGQIDAKMQAVADKLKEAAALLEGNVTVADGNLQGVTGKIAFTARDGQLLIGLMTSPEELETLTVIQN